MRLAALALAAASAVGHGGPATTATTTEVEQLFAAFSPARLDVVTGDTVRWHNASVRAHTVTADDGSFDSGRMSGGRTFAHTYGAPGAAPYHCSLHAGMVGEVRVHDLLLHPPAAPAAPRRPFPLRGRAALPAGTPVTIEADAGTGFAPVATTAVDEDGTFAASPTIGATATYRATAAGRSSPPVQVLVLDRTVRAQVRREGRRLSVDVRVTPASPGATVVLQLHLHDRFGWWPVQRARLDHHSRARLRMRLRRHPRARVLLTLPDGATVLARTGPLSTGR